MKGRTVFALIVRFIVLPDHLEAFDTLDYHSKEDLQRWEIDRRVDEFVNKRPEEWDKTLVEKLKIRPNQLSSDWGLCLRLLRDEIQLSTPAARLTKNISPVFRMAQENQVLVLHSCVMKSISLKYWI